MILQTLMSAVASAGSKSFQSKSKRRQSRGGLGGHTADNHPLRVLKIHYSGGRVVQQRQGKPWQHIRLNHMDVAFAHLAREWQLVQSCLPLFLV